MVDEKKDEGVGDTIKILLEEALEQQRKVMIDNFTQVLRWLPIGDASSSNNHSRGTTVIDIFGHCNPNQTCP